MYRNLSFEVLFALKIFSEKVNYVVRRKEETNLRRRIVTTGAQLAGEERVGPFFKSEKNCPDFGKRKDTYLFRGKMFFPAGPVFHML